ncbi:aminopeptidase [Asanoa ishikariensis]|uniref:Aminopeptidase N n=1 Tax=Asanoa ishikariensis TaxID=137265 RepID=A0A1H3NDC8_9ACTN|nr:aminopeptidase N [Asanoa ishikariensis]GIF68699.1 aminopeptidase [Asanoa ishikariensis]SDY86764.1 Membrane alanyl aminopeptidase Metallo peptidase. MEROPS family M01 [Asanoa ishikariensis]
MRSLTQQEATDRAAAITVESYTIDLDVTTDDHFRSTTTVRFRATEPGSSTFAEVKPVRLHAATLNGATLDPATLDGNRLALADLRADNVLTVEADMAYSNSSEGLHRFVDPADGGVYLHATSFLDEAQRIFACFDQTDLKAPVNMRVTAPTGWTVAANAAVASSTPKGATTTWEFATSEPLATYFVTVIAGPYHVVRSAHDGIPLALYCKASSAEHLDKDAEEIFEITRQCLDKFHELFGYRYPFGKYEQAFVPEFNAGAMENPGLVVIRDEYVFRSAVTDSERELRAITIAHEMAHMWFGDLVTMRWWDDLWLNESFAEYMGIRVTAEATRFRTAWTSFGMRRKAWGYETDQRPSTHPVAPTSVPNSADALVNFDGISYAKGASALRQLVAWVGDEAFLAGIRAHFQTHAFGNATLADLLAALTSASGRDLSAWAAVWLREAGVNTLRVSAPAGGGVAVLQSGDVLRPHRVAFGLYDRGEGGAATLRRRVEVDVAGPRTEVPELRDEPAADLLLLNDGDLTFAKVRLDETSAAAVPAVLPGLRDPLSRAVVWTSMIDAVRDAERPVTDLVDLLVAALPAESEVIVVQDALLQGRALINRYLPPAERVAAMARVASVCEELVAAPDADASRRLAAMRSLVDSSVDEMRLLGWLDGAGVPDAIEVDRELRWRIVLRLAVLGAIDVDRIAAELDADRSATGAEWAARARAARPDPAAKAVAWHAVINDDQLSNRLLEANGRGLFQPEQVELTAPYVERYFLEMPGAAMRRTPYAAERLSDLTFPRYAVEARTRELAAKMLTRDDLPPALRRIVIDNDDDLRLALAARAR